MLQKRWSPLLVEEWLAKNGAKLTRQENYLFVGWCYVLVDLG